MWQFIVNALGITYFLAWSASFYPQVLLNHRRHSTSGLSPTFALLNPLGFISYLSYTLILSYSSVVRSQYQRRHHGNYPEVEGADIAFAGHALVLSSITMGQWLYYRNRNPVVPKVLEGEAAPLLGQEEEETIVDEARIKAFKSSTKIHPFTWFSLVVMALCLVIAAALVRAGKYEELDLVYCVSYVKLYISFAKYVPQMWSNYKRKTTLGFSILVIVFDVIGSLTSLSQLIISSVFLTHDASGIIANPTKLGLALVTLAMDVGFLGQRWWWGVPGEVRVVEEGEGEEEGV